MDEPLRLNLRFAAACTLAAAGLILLGLAVHAVPAHADPHFGLSELSTASNNADSVEANPLAADWTWHHVFPLAHDSRGRDWRLDTDNVVLVTQAVALDPVFTLWSALSYSGGSSFPRDTTAWKDSVMAVVERYDGDGHDDFSGLVTPVKFWHVEQELSWWDDSAAHYSLYLGLTRRAILAADPTATVVCAGLDSGRLWGCAYRRGFVKMPPSSTQTYSDASLDRFEARIDTILGGGFYDVVDMHSYEQESLLRGKTDYVRSLMANPSLPIWCIEAGGPFLTRAQGYTDTLNAQMVVRLFTEAFAVDIPRYTAILYQYGGGSQFYNEPWTNLSLTDHASVPYEFKPAYWTYQQMTQMVKGWTSVSDLTARTSTEDRDVFRIRFVVAGDPVDVYWCDADTVFDAPVSTAYAKVTHILTRAGQKPADALIDYRTASGGSVALPVGPDPVYVQGVAQNPVGIGAPGDVAGVLRAEPSPARGTVTVSWRGTSMARPVAGTLALYGVNGRRLSTRTVAASMWQAGFALDLRDTNGRPMRPGLYWIAARLADGRQATARFVVVR